MYTLPPLQGYCDKRDINGRCDSSVGPDLDSAFDAGLNPDKVSKGRQRATFALALTNVAEMPGYPTKKFVFGRPDTRTNALISLTSFCLSSDHRA